MSPDIWSLYTLMLKSRLFEEAITQLWQDGLISGEMHLGTGEEAIIAGVVPHLREGDAMAVDHRGSAALLMRGVDPVLILRELLGFPDGLSGGRGGHMHLFSKEHLAASSGIVGAAGPVAVGFALAGQFLRSGTLSVAFFGEGAMNQGMMMESMNLAAVWKLPVLFVCKDDAWSITTRSAVMTGGDLSERAHGLGLLAYEADGRDVASVWEISKKAIEGVRQGQGPAFLHASCVHLEGHFLGFQLLRQARAPFQESAKSSIPLLKGLLRPGGVAFKERLDGMQFVTGALKATRQDARQDPASDPVRYTRNLLQVEPERLKNLEDKVEKEISEILATGVKETAE